MASSQANDNGVVWAGRQHWIVLGGPAVVLAWGVIGLVSMLVGVDANAFAFTGIFIGLPIGAIWMVLSVIRWRSNVFFVDEDSVGGQRGVFVKRRLDRNLYSSVTDVRISRNPLGVILGFGDVLIESRGNAPEVVKALADADGMVAAARQVMKQHQSGKAMTHATQMTAAATAVSAQAAVADMTQCPSCGTLQPTGTKFCSSCGAQVSSQCSKCGMGFTGRFCTECGTSALGPAAVENALS